jgi:hypothetical protein
MRPYRLGEEPGQACLAGSGRAPQEDRREVAALDGTTKRAAFADEVFLADEFVEGSGSHAGGEGLAFERRPEECLGPGSEASRRGAPGWHEPMVAPGQLSVVRSG